MNKKKIIIILAIILIILNIARIIVQHDWIFPVISSLIMIALIWVNLKSKD